MSTDGVMPSPGFSKLDRVLDLVTQHDASYRNQELRMSEFLKRVSGLEEQLVAQKLQIEEQAAAQQRLQSPEWLKDLDVKSELDSARGAMERLHRQLLHITQQQEADQETMQTIVAKLKGQSSAIEEVRLMASPVKMIRMEMDELSRGVSRLSSEVSGIRDCMEENQTNSNHLAQGLEEVTACLTEMRALQKSGKDDLRAIAKQEGQALKRNLEGQLAVIRDKQQALDNTVRKVASDTAEATITSASEGKHMLEELMEKVQSLDDEQARSRRRVEKHQQELTEVRRTSSGQNASTSATLEELHDNITTLTSSVSKLQDKQAARGAATSEAVRLLTAQLEEVRMIQSAQTTSQEPSAVREQLEVLQEEFQQRGDDLASLAESMMGVLRSQAVCCSTALDTTRAAVAAVAPGQLSAPMLSSPLYPPPFPSQGGWTAGGGPLTWRSIYQTPGAGLVAASAVAAEQQQQLFQGLAELQGIAARLKAHCSARRLVSITPQSPRARRAPMHQGGTPVAVHT